MFHFQNLINNEFAISVKKGIMNANEKVDDFEPSEYQQKMFNKLNIAINNNAFDLDTDNNDDNNEVLPAIDCN